MSMLMVDVTVMLSDAERDHIRGQAAKICEDAGLEVVMASLPKEVPVKVEVLVRGK
jgi:hypothetical protein